MTMPDTSSSRSPQIQPGATQDAGSDAGTAPSARQQIRDVKDQVVGQAKTTFEQARDRASSSLGESRSQIAEQIGGVAQAFRRTSDQLRAENQTKIAGLADTAARQVEQVADYLRRNDLRAMREDVERLARRQPAAVIGGALAVGLLAARFFKSSGKSSGHRTADMGGGYAGA